jgi:hypothetical protein
MRKKKTNWKTAGTQTFQMHWSSPKSKWKAQEK